MNLQKITFEHSLFAAALLLGVAIRFVNLGTAPLTDSEANLALQALALAKGNSIAAQALSPEPGYIVLTSWLFSMFGSSNFLARFWPAVAGSLLVLLPWIISRPRSIQRGLDMDADTKRGCTARYQRRHQRWLTHRCAPTNGHRYGIWIGADPRVGSRIPPGWWNNDGCGVFIISQQHLHRPAVE